MIYHYPVQWPIGWPRSKYQEAAAFKVGYTQAEQELQRELELLGVDSAYISTNRPLRIDGQPRGDMRMESVDPAVAVHFVRHGQALCIPCDKFTTVRDNIRAIGLTIEAIRRMERYGTKNTVEATLAGFAALPETASESVGPRPWPVVLQVSPDADKDVIRAVGRKLLAKYHPDNQQTGDLIKFEEVMQAMREAGVA